MHDLTSSLQAESLAVAYSRQRKLLERDEARILKFLKSRNDADSGARSLTERLSAAGIDPVEWEQILLRSGADELPAPDASPDAVRRLQTLAAFMSQREGKGVTPTDQARLGGVLAQVEGEMNALVEKSERRIDRFLAVLREDEVVSGGSKGKRQAVARSKLMAMLAEIIQELCQPLSVVSCTLGMLEAQSLGGLAGSQLEMVKLARESNERLEGLVDKLRNISGNPTSLSPDAAIIGTLYES